MVQLSEKGFIVGISITGGKYSKIDELNLWEILSI
jgi:hypothetical protein